MVIHKGVRTKIARHNGLKYVRKKNYICRLGMFRAIDEKKWSYFWKKVTCKNCLRIRFNRDAKKVMGYIRRGKE